MNSIDDINCLFGVFRTASHSKIIHSCGDVTIMIAGKGLQISTYARHLWPLSSEASLVAYHPHTKTRCIRL